MCVCVCVFPEGELIHAERKNNKYLRSLISCVLVSDAFRQKQSTHDAHSEREREVLAHHYVFLNLSLV